MNELPHHNIALKGGRPTWRVRRKDFDAWLAGRTNRPGREDVEAFARQYMR